MEFFTKSDFLEKIDSMSIYESEYETIRFLLDNVDSVLFTRILEEIFNKNISFQDFNQIFKGNEYSTILKNNLDSQRNLKRKLEMFLEFKKDVIGSSILTDQNISISDSNELRFLFTEEVQRSRRNILYSLFDGINSDSPIVRLSKMKMIDYLKNNFNKSVVIYTEIENIESKQFYETSTFSINTQPENTREYNPDDGFFVNEAKMIVSKNYPNAKTKINLTDKKIFANSQNNLTEKNRNINPEDILNKIMLFADKEIIALNVEDQILDKADVNFMKNNNIPEDQVKKLKALSLFIKKTETALSEAK